MRKGINIFFILSVLTVWPVTSWARNVSYVGGWTSLGYSDDDSFSAVVHYTPHRKFSIGYRYELFREEEWHYNGLQVNYLAKRWNGPDYQANLYVLSGVGTAYSNYSQFDLESGFAGQVGIAADWENRRYFVSYENRYVGAGPIHESFTQKGRVGIAPYIAEFGSLHTWFMLEANLNDDRDEELTMTPLFRFFKGSVMTELGWTVGGGPLANWRFLF